MMIDCLPRPTDRRVCLHQFGGGFLGTVLGTLWSGQEQPSAAEPPLPKAKSVIYLFMCGGASHIDTFDPKGNQWAGKLIDAVGFGDNQAEMQRPVIPCRRTFTRCGESGIPVSDWFPHVGSVIDEIAVIRSMYSHEIDHFSAVSEVSTGHQRRVFDHPCLGSWVSYALGTENKNLPAFVNIGRPTSPVQLSGGYLGATHSGTPFYNGETPIPNLRLPVTVNRSEREQQLTLLNELNRDFRRAYATNSSISARNRTYELAAAMQLSAPQIVDFRNETPDVLQEYGINSPETMNFGRQLLLARRLVENGVRFVQVCHGGGGNGKWDAHGDIESHGPVCGQTDKPIAGLIRDLKQRGLLNETLVVWTTEFGRTPWSQNTTGRDHNPRGFSSWLAGGGIRGGMTHGATDHVGYHAVENRHYIADLQATILHQLGVDASQMEVTLGGQPLRLVEEHAEPIMPVIS